MASPYEIIKGERLIKVSQPSSINITVEQIKKYFKDRAYRQCEEAIIRALYMYHYLNNFNISRFCDNYLKDKGKDSYTHTIKLLWEEGVIEKYSYGKAYFYCLSESGKAFAEEKYDKKQKRILLPPEQTEYGILSCASLAQWHISLICGDKVIKSKFYEEIWIGNYEIAMPSYAEILKNGFKYHIYSITIPKDKEYLDTFIMGLKGTNHALRGKIQGSRKDIFITVLVASSTIEMENISNILKGMKDTQDLKLYYVLDENTTMTQGLDLIYYHEVDEENTVLKSLQFKK